MRPFLTLHDPAAARRYYEQGVWQSDTLYALLARHAAERPDAPALHDGRRTLTWQQLRAWVDGVAADLQAKGFAGGDRVSVWLPNRAEAVVMFLACSRKGFVCNPSLHQTYTCGEIGTLLQRLERPRAADRARLGRGSRARRPRQGPRRRRLAQGRLHARHHAGTGARTTSRAVQRSRQDRLSRLHLRHHRHAQGRDALGQHAARQRPRHGARLEPWTRTRCCSACRRCRITSPRSASSSGWSPAAGS